VGWISKVIISSIIPIFLFTTIPLSLLLDHPKILKWEGLEEGVPPLTTTTQTPDNNNPTEEEATAATLMTLQPMGMPIFPFIASPEVLEGKLYGTNPTSFFLISSHLCT